VTFDSRDMGLRGRIGGYSRASKYPADELTRDARAGFLKRFEPSAELNLSPEEFQRRTLANLRCHMARLSRLSSRARRR